MARHQVRIEITDGNCHHCGLSVMTGKELEDELRSRERAVWPDEPSPFEEPFWLEVDGENAFPPEEAVSGNEAVPQDAAVSSLSPVDNASRTTDRPIESSERDPRTSVSEP